MVQSLKSSSHPFSCLMNWWKCTKISTHYIAISTLHSNDQKIIFKGFFKAEKVHCKSWKVFPLNFTSQSQHLYLLAPWWKVIDHFSPYLGQESFTLLTNSSGGQEKCVTNEQSQNGPSFFAFAVSKRPNHRPSSNKC